MYCNNPLNTKRPIWQLTIEIYITKTNHKSPSPAGYLPASEPEPEVALQTTSLTFIKEETLGAICKIAPARVNKLLPI
jgi:hypothetical protein